MKSALTLVTLCCLSACATAPVPALPKLDLPTQFVEAGDGIAVAPIDPARYCLDGRSGFSPTCRQTSRPTAHPDSGWINNGEQALASWWSVFQDSQLDALLARAEAGNPGLAVLAARHRAASALLARSEAEALPQIGLDAEAKLGSSGKRGTALTATARWEIDLWGRVALRTDAARFDAAASLADLRAARLSLQGLIVEAWYRGQVAAQRRALLQQAVADQTQFLQRIEARREAGVATGLDVTSAREALASLRVREDRAVLEASHARSALAELLGEPAWQPSSFSAERPALAAPPHLLPSALLRQRPDIDAAFQQVAAANARLGLANTAWYPNLDLGANAGFSKLTDSPLKVWSMGPAVALTLLDFGAREADTARAQADLDAATARYREVVLHAFRETEDALAAVRWLDRAALHQSAALAAATEARAIAQARYEAGTISRLELLIAQRTETDAHLAALDLWRERLSARVTLLKIQG